MQLDNSLKNTLQRLQSKLAGIQPSGLPKNELFHTYLSRTLNEFQATFYDLPITRISGLTAAFTVSANIIFGT